MPLVDYDSSSDDEESRQDKKLQQYKQERREEQRGEKASPDESSAAATVPPLFSPSQPKSNSSHSMYHFPEVVVSPPNSLSMEKLPDASILLSSPLLSQHYDGIDTSFCKASTITETASKKREEPNGSAIIYPRNKLPRGSLPHSRNIPDTVSGTLIPPQIKGRSNVVTEDINRLFANRR